MYILKTETKGQLKLIYWTIDGEHIFRIQTLPILKKGNDNNAAAIRANTKHFR